MIYKDRYIPLKADQPAEMHDIFTLGRPLQIVLGPQHIYSMRNSSTFRSITQLWHPSLFPQCEVHPTPTLTLRT